MPIVGYVFPLSAPAGGKIQMFLSDVTARTTTLVAERVGKATEPITCTASVAPRDPPAYSGCNWPGQDLPLTKPGGVPSSGIYVLKEGTTEIAAFVVRPPARAARHLVLVPFATTQAYNETGGGGFYSGPRRGTVSFLRPTPVGGMNAARDLCRPFVEWFEQNYPSEPLDYCTSLDLHADPTLLDGYTLLFILGHDEYWSQEMLASLERFTLGGGNVVCLSGNTAYGRVRFDDQTIAGTLYKNAAMSLFIPSTSDSLLSGIAGLPPDQYAARLQRYLRSPTGLFTNPPTSSPQNRALGVGMTSGFWGNLETLGYSPNIPNPTAHWAFQGVVFEKPDHAPPYFGPKLFTYETDAAEVEKGPDGFWYVTGEEGTPRNFTVLAFADLRTAGANKPGMATLGYFTRNGTVFAAGTTEWVKRLSDANVSRVTKNVVDRLGNMSAPAQRWNTWAAWEEIDEAYFVRGMAAAGGMLFVTTAEGKLWRRPPVAARIGWWLTGENIPATTRALTATSGALYAVLDQSQPRLTRYGFGFGERSWKSLEPAEMFKSQDGTLLSIKHLANVGRTLFAVASVATPNGSQDLLLWSSADDGKRWTPAPYFSMGGVNIVALTAVNDQLFAATDDNRLLRTPTRFVTDGGGGWEHIGHAYGAVALAAIEGMLYALAKSDTSDRYRLWRRDLHHFEIDPDYCK